MKLKISKKEISLIHNVLGNIVSHSNCENYYVYKNKLIIPIISDEPNDNDFSRIYSFVVVTLLNSVTNSSDKNSIVLEKELFELLDNLPKGEFLISQKDDISFTIKNLSSDVLYTLEYTPESLLFFNIIDSKNGIEKSILENAISINTGIFNNPQKDSIKRINIPKINSKHRLLFNSSGNIISGNINESSYEVFNYKEDIKDPNFYLTHYKIKEGEYFFYNSKEICMIYNDMVRYVIKKVPNLFNLPILTESVAYFKTQKANQTNFSERTISKNGANLIIER